MKRTLIAAAFLLSLPAAAQSTMGSQPATPFRDTSILKPPAGAKVAIIEFEDLECPLCAHDSPIVRAAMAHYNVPRVHHDFLIPTHSWSRSAAIDARFLEDNVSLAVAEDFRRDVFANQSVIAGPDDLQQFARKWFQSHGRQMPFLIDPSGRCATEVDADCKLGARVGVLHTPTIVVATAKSWIEVTDATQLYAAIDRAEADGDTSRARTVARRHTP